MYVVLWKWKRGQHSIIFGGTCILVFIKKFGNYFVINQALLNLLQTKHNLFYQVVMRKNFQFSMPCKRSLFWHKNVPQCFCDICTKNPLTDIWWIKSCHFSSKNVLWKRGNKMVQIYNALKKIPFKWALRVKAFSNADRYLNEIFKNTFFKPGKLKVSQYSCWSNLELTENFCHSSEQKCFYSVCRRWWTFKLYFRENLLLHVTRKKFLFSMTIIMVL